MSATEPPTRILHLLPDLDLAGGQMILRRTIHALDGPEWEHVVAAFGGGPLLEEYRQDGIRCELYKQINGGRIVFSHGDAEAELMEHTPDRIALVLVIGCHKDKRFSHCFQFSGHADYRAAISDGKSL